MKTRCLYDELISVNVLESMFHPKNRNKHPEDQIRRLANILEYQGVRYPVKISRLSNKITSGHGRVLAAKHNGWNEFPVNYQEYESEEQEYADLQADNAIASWSELDLTNVNIDIPDLGPDFDLDMLGIKDFVLEPIEKFEAQCDEDEVPDNVDTRCKRGDVWTLGSHRLVCGDSTSIDDVEKLMDGDKADMVYTDPPYGINGKGDRTNRNTGLADNHNLKDFKDDTVQYAVAAYNLCEGLNILKHVWWGANYYCHSLRQSNNWFIWDKRVEDKMKDHQSDCEMAWVKSEYSSVRIFRHLWRGFNKDSERNQPRVHPTQKPIALAEWAFDYFKNVLSVLDLFGGSGSTLIACEKTNRKCFMMELDEHYCDVILSRWEKYTGKTAKMEEKDAIKVRQEQKSSE